MVTCDRVLGWCPSVRLQRYLRKIMGCMLHDSMLEQVVLDGEEVNRWPFASARLIWTNERNRESAALVSELRLKTFSPRILIANKIQR